MRYLVERAKGLNGAEALRLAGLTIAKASRVGIEWNALTYAGHTIWNVHAEPGTGARRRPRSDWVVQRDTHPALITDAQAEAILARLEIYSRKAVRARSGPRILSGLLMTPDGRRWEADRGHYRAGSRGRHVAAEPLESEVVDRIWEDLQSPAFTKALLRAAQAQASEADGDPAADLRATVMALDKRIDRLVELATESDTPGPLLRQMEAAERERVGLVRQIGEVENEYRRSAALGRLTEADVKRTLAALADELRERDGLKSALVGLLERIELDPKTDRSASFTGLGWRPHGDSNPGRNRERAAFAVRGRSRVSPAVRLKPLQGLHFPSVRVRLRP